MGLRPIGGAPVGVPTGRRNGGSAADGTPESGDLAVEWGCGLR